MDNKQKMFNFYFFNMGTGWKTFPPSFFTNFFGTRQTFLEENKEILKALICDVLMTESLLGFDATKIYGDDTKSHIQDWSHSHLVVYPLATYNLPNWMLFTPSGPR